VLAHLLLGGIYSKARTRGIAQPHPEPAIPDFCALDPRIDDKLNDILHHCLARDLTRRYATADQFDV